VFCSYRLGYRTPSTLSLGEFRHRAEAAVASGLHYLDLTPVTGELFLHKEAVAIIREAKRTGFRHVGTYTNGILLRKHGVKEILESGLDVLLISFPGFDRRAYKLVYGVEKYDDFEQSIRELLDVHATTKSEVYVIFEPRTYLTLRQIERSEFYRGHLAPRLGERVILRQPVRVFDTWGGEIRRKDLPRGMKLRAISVKSLAPLKRVHPCVHLYSMGVLVNGDVRLCNCRYDSTIETAKDSLRLDNLMNCDGDLVSLLKANRTKIAGIRADFVRGKLPELCKRCPFYSPAEVVPDDVLN
jgi:predicted nucleotidyltransferase